VVAALGQVDGHNLEVGGMHGPEFSELGKGQSTQNLISARQLQLHQDHVDQRCH